MKKVNKVIYAELTYMRCDIPMEQWPKWIKELHSDLSELDWNFTGMAEHSSTFQSVIRFLRGRNIWYSMSKGKCARDRL